MLTLLGLTLALVLMAAFIHAELRACLYEITLSNGLEVLVNPEMYEEIGRRFQMLDDPDLLRRWDRAVLNVLRAERPNEWRFLVRSLRQDTSPSRHHHEPLNV
jgi:hypothetical protein